MIYFDNAASSFPKPPEVAKAMTKAVNEYGANPGRSGHYLSIYAAEMVFSCRERIAALFNALLENVIFTSNATHAINTVLKGALRAGDHIVISDIEHNAVARPLKVLEDFNITASLARVDFEDDEKTVKSFEEQITPQTAMIACTHASNVTGRILPIEKIGALAKKHNLMFMVDAAQTAGAHNIDVQALNIDFLCLPGHKGLYGPQGTGLLILNTDKSLKTLTEGGTGGNSFEPLQPIYPPERYESGTLNTPGIVGLKEGVNYILNTGIDKINAYEKELLLYAYDTLSEIKEVKLYSKRPESFYTAVLPFNIENVHSNIVAEFLNKYGVLTRSGFHCAPSAHLRLDTVETGAVRMSFGVYNTKQEIKYAANIIKDFIKSK